MVQISEVNIISIDKGEESWAIEGEILFESDLTTAFSVNYLQEYDELDELEIEFNPGQYDMGILKEMIVSQAESYDE